MKKNKGSVYCVLLLFLGVGGWPLDSFCTGDIQWIWKPMDGAVQIHQLIDLTSSPECLSVKLENATDPFLVPSIKPFNADAMKYLYLEVSSESRCRIHIFYSTEGILSFSEGRSFRGNRLRTTIERKILCVDLSELKDWTGMVQSLRLDLEGGKAGESFQLYRLGVSERVLPNPSIRVVSIKSDGSMNLPNDRMAAWHQCQVATDEEVPNSSIGTTINDRPSMVDTYLLAKLVPFIEVGGTLVSPVQAENQMVDDVPGGVVALFEIAGIKVKTEIYAHMLGREETAWEGGASYSIKTDPPTPVSLRIGSAEVVGLLDPRVLRLRTDKVGLPTDQFAKRDGTIFFSSEKHPMQLAITSSHSGEIREVKGAGSYLEIHSVTGEITTVFGFAQDATRASELAHLDPDRERVRIQEYYQSLFQNKIDTPDQTMNDAFRSALMTLEYTWQAPYGWLECIHHWIALWHMQASGCAPYLGQTDRARSCILSHAEKLYDSGAAPQILPGGFVHRDFGGSNQFFAWQISEFFDFTNDLEFARKMLPVLEQVIAQTFEEYDRDHDGLLAWGQQIGNQEDYVSTPYNGTTPTIEGIRMLATQAKLAKALGDQEKADQAHAKAGRIQTKLIQQLWKKDLGRFVFFEDPLGIQRLDGQYHTFLYPALWNMVDPLDAYSSVRQVRDRLTGSGGEVYCSNNFPNHVPGTWGMQAGAAQQPWAAWGLAAVGLWNEAWQPLHAVAEWVMNEDHRGAWPEVSVESTATYFSPPAGLFVQSVIESLFGLSVDRPNQTLKISPSFPDHWDHASLELAEFKVDYQKNGNQVSYRIESQEAIRRTIRWALPVCSIKSFQINGKDNPYSLEPGIGCLWLLAESEPVKETLVQIQISPIEIWAKQPASIAEGEPFQIEINGAKMVAIEDRAGLFSRIDLESNTRMTGTVNKGLLDPYLKYGRLGQLTFSRRSCFMECETPSGSPFWFPIDFVVLPPYEAALSESFRLEGGSVQGSLVIRNNRSSVLKEELILRTYGCQMTIPVELGPHSEQVYPLSLPKSILGLISRGENHAELQFPDQTVVNIQYEGNGVLDLIPNLVGKLTDQYEPIPLPENQLVADTEWQRFRRFYCIGHGPWNGSRPPLEKIGEQPLLSVPSLPGLSFLNPNRKLAVASRELGEPVVTVPLEGKFCKKIYLLVVPFLDNHDPYAPVARVLVESKEGSTGGVSQQIGKGYYSQTLHFPGQVDWWFPQEAVGGFVTTPGHRKDRFGLLPLLPEGASDWEEGIPPLFPQKEFYSSSHTLVTPSSVMTVIEVVLPEVLPVTSVSLETLGMDPVMGLVGVTIEKPHQKSPDILEYFPDHYVGVPEILFDLTNGNLAGWEFEGDCFSVQEAIGYRSLNSLKGGKLRQARRFHPLSGRSTNISIFCFMEGIPRVRMDPVH